MRESAHAAFSVVRSNAKKYKIDAKMLARHDIHVHVPAGAVPKDGPSAGVATFTALVSLLKDRPCRSDVAMTGEITLRGQVLPVGGLKEKTLAAHRAGIGMIIFPDRNKKDLDEVPAEIRKQIKFVPVKTVDEVLKAALEPKRKKRGKQAKKTIAKKTAVKKTGTKATRKKPAAKKTKKKTRVKKK